MVGELATIHRTTRHPMNPPTNAPEIILHCLLACEQEAIARDFTKELGHDIYNGCIQDDLEEWDEDRFIAWTDSLLASHQAKHREQEVIGLYDEINQIMGKYGKLLK